MLLDMSSTSTMSSGGRRTVGRPGRTVRVVVTSHTRVLRVRLLLPALPPPPLRVVAGASDCCCDCCCCSWLCGLCVWCGAACCCGACLRTKCRERTRPDSTHCCFRRRHRDDAHTAHCCCHEQYTVCAPMSVPRAAAGRPRGCRAGPPPTIAHVQVRGSRGAAQLHLVSDAPWRRRYTQRMWRTHLCCVCVLLFLLFVFCFL